MDFVKQEYRKALRYPQVGISVFIYLPNYAQKFWLRITRHL